MTQAFELMNLKESFDKKVSADFIPNKLIKILKGLLNAILC